MQEKLINSLFWLASRLPLTWIRGLGVMVGNAHYWLNSRAARVTRKNLTLCFPEQPNQIREKQVRASLQETGKTALEAAYIWKRSGAEICSKIRLEDTHLLDRAIQRGKGVMVLAPHIGNWEVIGHLLPQFAPTIVLFRPPRFAAIGSMMKLSREAMGISVFPADRSGVAQTLKALKAGKMTGILPDQVPEAGSGVFAPFFGVPALTMSLVQRLSQKTGCSVVMAAIIREPGGYVLRLLEADPDVCHEDSQLAAAALNRSVEAVVQLAPEQYQWEYKRFRERPEGVPSHYKNML